MIRKSGCEIDTHTTATSLWGQQDYPYFNPRTLSRVVSSLKYRIVLAFKGFSFQEWKLPLLPAGFRAFLQKSPMLPLRWYEGLSPVQVRQCHIFYQVLFHWLVCHILIRLSLFCRTISMVYFLNDVEEGGELVFPLANNQRFEVAGPAILILRALILFHQKVHSPNSSKTNV